MTTIDFQRLKELRAFLFGLEAGGRGAFGGGIYIPKHYKDALDIAIAEEATSKDPVVSQTTTSAIKNTPDQETFADIPTDPRHPPGVGGI